MISLTFETDTRGMGKVKAKFKRFGPAYSEAWAKKVGMASQRIVPVDTGLLRKDMRIFRTADGGFSVSYGQIADYAAIIHNDTSLQLKNGEHFYLRKPAMSVKLTEKEASKVYRGS